MTISTLINNFKSLNTNNVIEQSFIETSSEFERLNVEQLRAGKTKTGASISPRYKNPKYAAKKNQMNQAPGFGVPDLILTGSFTSKLKMTVEGDVLKEYSNDEKGPDLEAKYPDILGLGTTYKKSYIDESLRPTVNGKISAITGLKFGA